PPRAVLSRALPPVEQAHGASRLRCLSTGGIPLLLPPAKPSERSGARRAGSRSVNQRLAGGLRAAGERDATAVAGDRDAGPVGLDAGLQVRERLRLVVRLHM